MISILLKADTFIFRLQFRGFLVCKSLFYRHFLIMIKVMWGVEAVAVGSEAFVLGMKEKMGMSVLGRKVNLDNDIYTLREPESAYNAHFDSKKVALSTENTVYFDEIL